MNEYTLELRTPGTAVKLAQDLTEANEEGIEFRAEFKLDCFEDVFVIAMYGESGFIGYY